jgi:hypothetical protein
VSENGIADRWEHIANRFGARIRQGCGEHATKIFVNLGSFTHPGAHSAGPASAGPFFVRVTTAPPAETKKSVPGERTDDPVRMYLREMGSVELLSREGEIAIAKRIEAGREAMIAGLCESPLTFQAITIWRDELNDGKVFLRDIIDLEATYAGPDAKGVAAMPPADGVGNGAPGVVGAVAQPQTVAPATAPPAATPFRQFFIHGKTRQARSQARRDPRGPAGTRWHWTAGF